jgi:Alcohol dehydrogenase GroES-like domain
MTSWLQQIVRPHCPARKFAPEKTELRYHTASQLVNLLRELSEDRRNCFGDLTYQLATGSGRGDGEGRNVGDRVSIMPLCYFGRCYYCRRGQNHLCRTPGVRRLKLGSGGMAPECVVNDQVTRLQDTISNEQRALIEPAAGAFYSVLRSRIEPAIQLC